MMTSYDYATQEMIEDCSRFLNNKNYVCMDIGDWRFMYDQDIYLNPNQDPIGFDLTPEEIWLDGEKEPPVLEHKCVCEYYQVVNFGCICKGN